MGWRSLGSPTSTRLEVFSLSVEITYGLERILMLLQVVDHFKNIQYADGTTYGELFLENDGNVSYGLRNTPLATVRVESAEYYAGTMRRAGIEVEIEDCKNIILKHSTTLAKSVNGHVQIQESLLNEVVNIVEAPVPVLGKFKESFLELREDHLTMEKLGTMLDQMTRVQNTVAKLSLELGINEDLLQTVDDVASLAMSDLAAAVVVEFASLSGIMARHCALRDGYSEQIAEALFKIMLPKFSGNRFPQTDVGILRVAWAASIYHIWRERNRRYFTNCSRSPDSIFSKICSDMKFRFKGLVHLKPRTISLEVQTLCKF